MQAIKHTESLSLMGSLQSHRSTAFATILQKSFQRGSRRLASGKVSEYYIDMKPTMLDPHGAEALANLLFTRLIGEDFAMVGGLELGAIPLVCNFSMLSAQRGFPKQAFFVRKAPKDHGTQKLIEGSDPAGQNVVILDDVTTSGGSAMKAVDAVQKVGGKVVLVLSIVDRQEGATEFYKERHIRFDSIFTRDELMAATAANTPSTSR